MKDLFNYLIYKFNMLFFKSSVLILTICIILIFIFTSDTTAKEYEISNYDVEMEVTEEGDFLVEEEITFHFIEGEFSYAYREIEGDNFSDLEFISIDGIDTTITNYELKKAKDLKITWYYDQVGANASFLFTYKAISGLQSKGDRNVIDWTPTGADWDVPIRDIDVHIILPWQLEEIKIEPLRDLKFKDKQEVHLYNKSLSAGKAYKVYLSFPEVISTGNTGNSSEWQLSDIYLFIAGIIFGLLIVIFDIVNRDKVSSVKGKKLVTDLSIYEKAAIFNDLNHIKKGITAQVFRMAKKGNIRLISSLKKGFLGSKQAEVTVELLDEGNLSNIEKEIINSLKRNDTLKKFSQDYKWFSKMEKTIKELMREKGFISREAEIKRDRTYLSSIIFILPSITGLIIGGIYGIPVIMATAIALFIISIGRLIKGAMINILTPEALYLKGNIAEEIEIRQDKLESFIKRKEGMGALGYFFAEIDYIILQKNFNSTVLHRYKKTFKEAKEVKIPDWLELDLSNLDSTLDALDIIEIIDYLFISMIVIASSTGTTTTGSGGGTAGGGGGGAG